MTGGAAPEPDGHNATGLRERLALATAPLSTGGAVLVAILLGGSLLWPTLILVAGSAATAAIAARRLPGRLRQEMFARAHTGLIAGLAATVVYDLVRYLAVALFSWSVSPFSAFPLFGRLLIGEHHGTTALWAAGIAFHALNGLGFAIGYTLVVPRPRLITAVAWAMVLELLTILLYPNWLGISAVGEFFSMSMLGHLGYGLTLGWIARRAVR